MAFGYILFKAMPIFKHVLLQFSFSINLLLAFCAFQTKLINLLSTRLLFPNCKHVLLILIILLGPNVLQMVSFQFTCVLIVNSRETYRKVTPAAVQASNTVGFDLFPALWAFSVSVALYPMMQHFLSGSGGFDIGGNAGSRGSLNTSLVDRVLAHWNKRFLWKLW